MGYNGRMPHPARAFRHGLPPLAAGLLLAASGWLGAGYRNGPTLEFEPQLVVRPSTARLVTVEGPAPTPDPTVPGRFALSQAGSSVELRQPGWPSVGADLNELRAVTTLRAPFPKATLSVSVKDDKQASVELLALPKKSEVRLTDGKARLEPGRHELLVQAEGYLPQRLTVDLKPGEAKAVAIELEALPRLPTLPAYPGQAFPSGGPGVPPPAARPVVPSPAYRPPAPAYRPPAPAYRPPVPAYRPPVPAPRFTPVAPPPKPPAAAPVPMFTPVGQ